MKCLSSTDRPCILEVLQNIVSPIWGNKPEKDVRGIVDTAVDMEGDLAFLVTLTPAKDSETSDYCMSLELCEQGKYEPVQYMKKGSFLINLNNCDNTLSRVADRIIAFTAEGG